VVATRRAIDHSITNTKISLLKEMKLMRLERLGLCSDDITSTARKSAVTGTSAWSALSSRENVAWLLVRDGLPTVRFQAIRDRDQKFEHMVQYRLPK